MAGKINHLIITAPAARFDEIVLWYQKALLPLGYIELRRFPGVVGMGPDGHADFWISAKENWSNNSIHIGFTAAGEKEPMAITRFIRTKLQLQTTRLLMRSIRQLLMREVNVMVLRD